MDYLMKTLAFIGATVYGIVASVLLGNLFLFATPWLMSFGWGGVFICAVLLIGIGYRVFYPIVNFIFIPVYFLVSVCPPAKYLCYVLYIMGGVLLIDLWKLDVEYTLANNIIAIIVSGTAILLYFFLAGAIHRASEEDYDSPEIYKAYKIEKKYYKEYCLVLAAFILPLMLYANCERKSDKYEEQVETEVSKGRKKKDDGIGEYIYRDKNRVLHTKNGCKAVYKDHGSQPVDVIRKEAVTEYYLENVCSQCVTDKHYNELKEIIYQRDINGRYDD